MRDKRIAALLLSAFCILQLSGCSKMQNEVIRADETLFAMNTYQHLLDVMKSL